jgi:hypothetical protein
VDHLKSIQEVTKAYKDNAEKKGFNALVYGDTGTGKTRLIKTARRPIYAYIFDPQGQVTIRDEIYHPETNPTGYIIADTRFQYDDPRDPKAYRAWENDYRQKRLNGFFDLFSTVAFDSITTWAQLIMNRVLKDAGRQPGGQVKYEGHTIESYGLPFQQDYGPEMSMIAHMIRDMLSLPCDCIFTAHPDKTTDSVSGKMFIGPMVTGKLKAKLPLLFTEIYAAVTQQTSAGPTWKLLTKNDGLYMARTRLGKEGIFATYEDPDIKALLKKAKVPTEDKELPWLQE